MTSQSIKWKPRAVLRKYDDDGNFLEEIVCEGNLLLTAGLDYITDHLVVGTGATFNNNAIRLGVGDDATAATLTDNDLSTSTNQYYQVLDGAPTQTDGAMEFIATFGTGEANFTWACWGLDYKSAGGGTTAGSTPNGLLNRKVFSFGTKSGGTWQLTVTVTLA